MTMRVTQELSAAAIKTYMRTTSARMFAAQTKVATGRAITKPSDDPGQLPRLLALKRNASEIEQYGRNISEGKAVVSSASSALEEISSLLIEAQEKTVGGLNGTVNDRSAVASEIDGILNQVIALANQKLGDRYLFGGTVTGRKPFAIAPDASGQLRVAYQGNQGVFSSEVGPGIVSSLNIPGSTAFAPSLRGATTFTGISGARAGQGTDNGTGVDHLVVAHGTTTYAGGGLSAGTSSAAGDTIIGPAGAHNVTIVSTDATGSSGQLQLNGGTIVSFTNPDTNVKLTGPNGEIVYVNTSSILANQTNVQVALTATGTLSTDGGTTSTPITYAANQQIVDSLSGRVLNIDSTLIRRAGTDTVHYHGTLDVFTALASIRDGLRGASSNVNPGAALDDVRAFLDELKTSHDTLLRAASELGTREIRLNAAEDRLGDIDTRVKKLVSDIEEVDISNAVIDLQSSETAYQSALSVASRVNNLSLLDYLR